MRRILEKILLLFLYSAVLFPVLILSGKEIPEIKQVTTHPAVDFSPSVSPDGRWLAFTSERSGNLDIWVKRLPRGRAVQVTTHRAEDSQPVWSPDGKRLAFVSKRRDAQGDIWLINLNLRSGGTPKGKPVQLTNYLGLERKPSFSPNGKSVAYTSDRDGMFNVWRVEVSSGKTRQLTISGGTDPAWSPKDNWILFTSFRADAGGDLFIINARKPEVQELNEIRVYPVTWGKVLDGQGTWSPDGTEIVFLRVNRDEDGDGSITPKDNGCLWQKKLVETGKILPEKIVLGKNEIQITTCLHRDGEPFWSYSKEILFTSNRGEGTDIWSVPVGGIFPKASSAEEQYTMVLDRFAAAVTREELLHSNLGYMRILDYFPEDSLWVVRSLLRIGETFQVLGKRDDAREIFQAISSEYSGQRREVAQAELRMATQEGDSLEVRIERCRRIIDLFSEERPVVAEAWIFLGDLYREMGKVGQSLAAYSEVIQLFPELRNRKAQAQLRIGDLLREEGQEETARQSYLSVLREFENVPIWRVRAGDRLLDQIKGLPQEKIRNYQQIVQQVRDLPSLAAKAQLSIGMVLMEQEKYEQALRELERVEEIVPKLLWAHAEAMILRAKIYGVLRDELKGILLLEHVLNVYGNLEGGRYALRAEDELFNLLFDSAERLKTLGDFTLASARYQKALTFRKNEIRVHRGLVETMFQTGKIDELIQDYQIKLEEQPENPVFLYGLGLCFSYKGEKYPNLLKQSNILLMQSLAEDYRLIYPYRTLSFNYELMEKMDEVKRQKKRGFFIRAGRTVIAPLRWLVGLLPFHGSETKVGYYERAIDALITAVEINDEKSDPKMEALLVQNLANNFYNLGEFGYKKAYNYFKIRLSLDSSFTHPLEKAVFYERTGHSGVVAEEIEEAIEFLQTSVNLYTKLGREEDLLRNQKMLAFTHQLAGEYEDAISIYEETTVKDERAEKWNEVERDYRNIAYNYYLMEEPEDALKYARKAEEIINRKEFSIKPPKKSSLRIEFFGLSIPVWGMEEIGGASAEGFSTAEEVALVYGVISRSLEILKSFREAAQYEEKRLEIFQKRKDKLAQRITFNRLGRLYYKMADYEEAWNYFYKSWKESKKGKTPDERGRRLNAINLGNVAVVELSLLDKEHHFEEAKRCLEEELEIISKELGVSNRDKLVLVNILGTLWTLKGKKVNGGGQELDVDIKRTLGQIDAFSRAETYFQEGLRSAREGKYWREEGIILKNLAEVSEIAHDDFSAYNRLQESYHVFEKRGGEEYLWRIEHSIANLLRRFSPEKYNLESKEQSQLDYYKRAMDRLEAIPVQEEEIEEWLSDRQERWNLYVDAAFEFAVQGLTEDALEIVERGREKAIADIIARRPPSLKRERHKIAWGNIRYIRSRLQEISKKLIEEEIGEKRTDILNELKNERKRYEIEYRDLLEDISNEDRVLAYLSGAEPVDLQQIKSILPENGGALSYLLGPEQTLLWMIDRDSIYNTILPVGQSFFNKKIQVFLQRVKEDSSVEEICRELYDILLRPVSSFFKEKISVLIVPDGILWNLPFGVLSDNGEILLEKTTVYNAPSLTAYSLAWERRKINQEQGALVGDFRDKIFLDQMKRATKKENLILGPKATEKALQEAASFSDIIQVERWIVYKEKDPLTSYIVLFSGDGQDGFLRAEELFFWDFKASLFFMPRPVGDVEMGWQVSLSFIYGLLYAGVPSVVVTLWSVDREAKKEFLESFYSQIHEISVSDAIAEAQLSVRDKYRSIRAWGGLILVGFPGMDRVEKIKFAKNNLVSTVLKGRAYEQKGEYSDAIATFESALDMAEAMGDSSSVHRIYQEIIRGCIGGKHYGKAAVYQERVLEAAKRFGDKEGIKSSLKNLVAFTLRNSDFNEAVRIKTEYINLLQKEENFDELASSLEELSFIHAAGRNYTEAVKSAEKAEYFYKETGDRAGQARALIMKGRFQLEGDDYWAARDNLSEGIDLIGNLIKTSPSDEKIKIELASGIQLLGLVYERLTQYEDAINFQKKGRTLFKELGKPVQASQGTQYLANLYWKRGDYRQALSAQKEALEAFESLGNKKLLAMAYSTQGLIHLSLGDISKAQEAEQKALDLVEEIGSKADKATILKNIGLISISDGNLSLAYEHFRKASMIDSILGFEAGLAYDQRNLGTLLIKLDRPLEGISLLKKGLFLSRKMKDSRNIVQCFYGLGQAYDHTGDWKTAVAVLDSGLAEASNLVIPELMWRLYRKRAAVFKSMGREKEALKDYYKAVEIVEALRAELKVEAFKQGFFDDKMDLYVDIVRLLLEMKRPIEAFDFVERAKSRNFIDMLGNQSLRLSEAQGELLNREQEARAAIQETQEYLKRLVYQKENLSADWEKEVEYQQKVLDENREKYEEVLISIQAENPELASFISVDPWDGYKVKEILPDNTALIEYFITKDELFCWAVMSGGIVGRKIEVEEQQLREKVKQFREAIQAHLSADKEGRELYEFLILPIEKALRNIHHVVFVPHGVLHYVPFAALLDNEGRYIIEKYSLSLSPSATVLGYCIDKGEKRRNKEKIKKVLALSNPDLGNPIYDLPFAEKEVMSLRRTYKNVKAYFGAEATERIVQSQIGNFSLIHFACHGTYESDTPLFSALLLSPEGEDDGRLEAHEIFSLKADCDLVTLSACETGLAKITQGDEIIGLARSFIFAGAPSIITSLWKVDDLATAVMVKRFYRYLDAGFSRAEALRKAQLLVKEAVNGHPAAWAAFGLTGDFR